MRFNKFLIAICVFTIASASQQSQDLTVVESVATDKHQSKSLISRASGARKYGYPYAIAPPLAPVISSRSDESEPLVADSPAKAFVTKVLSDEKPSGGLKNSVQKKRKIPFRFGTSRRHGLDTTEDRRLSSYREPKYRNFDDLESVFKPRRYDYEGSYEYGFPSKAPRKPAVSPRDPYLSPSHEPSNSFYPTVPKFKAYSGSYGKRIRQTPTYGAGSYEENTDTYHDQDQASYDNHNTESYDGISYGSQSQYPSKDSYYGYEEDYTIESNKPIIGDIRKRLLDYAGASDIYEGEPDYLQQIARNKNKYGSIGNDYYSYGKHRYDTPYQTYPYEESNMRFLKSRI